jgi:hypothetical protein
LQDAASSERDRPASSAGAVVSDTIKVPSTLSPDQSRFASLVTCTDPMTSAATITLRVFEREGLPSHPDDASMCGPTSLGRIVTTLRNPALSVSWGPSDLIAIVSDHGAISVANANGTGVTDLASGEPWSGDLLQWASGCVDMPGGPSL